MGQTLVEISHFSVSNAFSPKIGSAIINHLQHGHFLPNMERYSVDEFADQIAMDDLQAQKAINKIETQSGGPCKYSARKDFNGFIEFFDIIQNTHAKCVSKISTTL